MGRVSASRKERVFSRDEIEALIAEGRHIVIVNGKVLKCDAWLQYHPGGEISIRHFLGRDATDEVKGFHSPETLEYMTKYQIGTIEGRWTGFVPPIQGGKFRTREQIQYETAELDVLDKVNDSSDQSSEPSPVSSPELHSTLRNRGGIDPVSSATSISSVDLEDMDSDRMGTIDARTGKVFEIDALQYPPIDPEVQEDIIRKYRQLFERLKSEGLFECNYWAYGVETIRYSFLFSMAMLSIHWGWYSLAGVFIGCFWQQLVFTAHDSAHIGITHNFQVDSLIAIFIADFLGGLSIGWWKRNHNVHHVVTNSPEHDPDIQHVPFFAVSPRFFGSLRSSYYGHVMKYDAVARVFVRYQDYLYYVVLCFGRFNLYRLSWQYLLGSQPPRKGPARWHRWLEIAGHVFFWIWYGYGIIYKSIPTNSGRFAFFMVSHIVTSPLHLQITLSHFAMSTEELGVGESFPQKMLRTTMDVDCPQWLDFFHGGLQFQAIHHLYPRMPRHNLRQAQKLVQQFCEEVNVPYALFGFVDGNKAVLGRLGEVGRQAAILAKCQKTLARSDDFGMH
ncbi:fatty acid/sphingolipid desaturase [Eremomyces bilateralis CBS 781.70]|uniref:Delta 8-(E)-sphingolipid desaturase n=1 Tax=Eremomyces bilateralis CBS 781.70 TaxID=1392243 RepID=A0A6G1FTN2_9PEZI|nr:fatty acid/sphingolipid desaturase [Eremomyces bilateralis CBS 781.70]KAF1809068.1 fatty acid/sphingolipid desaturase [Eremomyces bilateralis CBS 781.70]